MQPPKGRSPFRSRGLWIAVGLLLIVTAAAVTVASQFDPRFRAWVAQEAAKQGVRLSFGDYSLSWNEVRLNGVSFARDRSLPVSGKIQSVVIRLSSLRPVAVELVHPDADVLSSLPDLLYQLRDQASGSQGSEHLPVTASALSLHWRTGYQNSPATDVSNGSLSFIGNTLIVSGDLTLLNHPLGKASVNAALDRQNVDFDLALPEAETASLHGEVHFAADPSTLTLTLKPTPVRTPLPGLALKAKAAQISGTLNLTIPSGLTASPASGRLSVSLEGFSPPLPPTLEGLSFGNRIEIASDLGLSRDYRTAALKNLHLVAGAFALVGSGSVERHDDFVTLELQLDGDLGCAALAEAATASSLGGALGRMLGNVARSTLTGSVHVSVGVQLDSRHPEAPSIDRTIGAGCGFDPPSLKLPSLLPSPK